MIEQSDDATEVWKGVLALQRDGVLVQHNAQNPHLRNKYASLEGVLRSVVPVLAAAGCVLMQPISFHEGRIVVTTRIVHAESGQWVQARAEAKPMSGNKGTNDLQQAGVAISYLRRYSVLSMLGLATTDDSDGAVIGVAPPKSWGVQQLEKAEAAGYDLALMGRFVGGNPDGWTSAKHAAAIKEFVTATKGQQVVDVVTSGSEKGKRYILTARPDGFQGLHCTCRASKECHHITEHANRAKAAA